MDPLHDDLQSTFFTRKNLLAALVVVLLIAAIPAAVFLIQRQQVFKSRASNTFIQFVGPNITPGPTGPITANSTVQIQLQSPRGGSH